jgi:hypothetical protein
LASMTCPALQYFPTLFRELKDFQGKRFRI